MIKRLAIILLVAGVGTASIKVAYEYFGQDSCLDKGGAWFGSMGCEKQSYRIDRIVVDKSDRQLWAFEGRRVVRTFRVALGGSPVGQKTQQGDNRTPEGTYPIVAHKLDSSFHRALRLGYPNVVQRAAAKAAGIDPGDDIMIHGLPNGLGWLGRTHLERDWTQGCIALTNDEIEWLFRFVADGTPVEIQA